MLKILSFFFIVLFVIPYLLRALLRFLFGSNAQRNQPSQPNRNASSRTQKPPQKKKVISKNEGEYVDYEIVDN